MSRFQLHHEAFFRTKSALALLDCAVLLELLKIGQFVPSNILVFVMFFSKLKRYGC